MQITVVIPSYKRPKLLSKCLKALQLQSLHKGDFEAIVVSDGPDEETAQVVAEWREAINVRYLALPNKKGPAAARNLGWLNARAAFIAFTDDDCMPDPFWLEMMIDSFKQGKAQVLTGRIIVPRHNGRPTDHELNTAGLESADLVTANCACTKAALLAVGGFDERFGMAWREDSDLEFKFLEQRIFIVQLNEAIVIHPVRQAPWGISLKEQKKTLYNALLYAKYPKLYRDRIQPVPPVLYYTIICGFLLMLIGAMSSSQGLLIAGLAVWSCFTLYFICKRLMRTSLNGGHIVEMVLTSILIPFLSVYWQWYGAFKYKVLFI